MLLTVLFTNKLLFLWNIKNILGSLDVSHILGT